MAEHGKEITDAAVRDMEYAEAVCKETLRLNPIVGSLFRKALRDFEVCGYRIRKVCPLLLRRAHTSGAASSLLILSVAVGVNGWASSLPWRLRSIDLSL